MTAVSTPRLHCGDGRIDTQAALRRRPYRHPGCTAATAVATPRLHCGDSRIFHHAHGQTLVKAKARRSAECNEEGARRRLSLLRGAFCIAIARKARLAVSALGRIGTFTLYS